MNRLADFATDMLYHHGEFVHAIPYHTGSCTPVRAFGASQLSAELWTGRRDCVRILRRRKINIRRIHIYASRTKPQTTAECLADVLLIQFAT
jgi:hypothetical protein